MSMERSALESLLDAAAAAVILSDFLEARRGVGERENERGEDIGAR